MLANGDAVELSKSITTFNKGLIECGYASLSDLVGHPAGFVWAFHGSSESNIDSILKTGFDPSLRSRQQHGPGEYFDLGNGTVAHLYDPKQSGVVVVCLIIRRRKNESVDGPWYKECCYVGRIDQLIAVVNNPTSGSSSYVLPIALSSKSYFLGSPFGWLARLNSSRVLSVLVDGGTWASYSAENMVLVRDEVARVRGIGGTGSPIQLQFTFCNFSYMYTLDFDEMLQCNQETNVNRTMKFVK